MTHRREIFTNAPIDLGAPNRPLSISIRKEERAAIFERAAELNLTMSAYVRQLIFRDLKKGEAS